LEVAAGGSGALIGVAITIGKGLLAALLLTVFPVQGGLAQTQPPCAIDFGGALYRAVFFHQSQPVSLPVPGLPPEVAARITRFNEKNQAFRSRLATPEGSQAGPELWQLEKRRQVERAIAVMLEAKDLQQLAADYAQKAVIYYEWEGRAENPLREAGFAEDYLRRQPHTPLKPYLYLFLAQRYRCAAEILSREYRTGPQKEARQKYLDYLKLAGQEPDPLIGLIAADLNAQPYLYFQAQPLPTAPRPEGSDHAIPAGQNRNRYQQLIKEQAPPTQTQAGYPPIAVGEALKVAEDYLQANRIETAGRYISAINLKYDDGSRPYPDGSRHRGLFWYLNWSWAAPRLGGELSMRIFMDRQIVLERHGP